MSSLLGLISYLSYPGASEKAVKFAVSLLLIYTSITPVLAFVRNFSDDALTDFVEEIKDNANEKLDSGNEEYLLVSEEALKEGICKLIFTEYGIPAENIEVYIHGFDFEKMRAERISILLSGKGALSDSRSIENLVNELGIGECEVNIEFG